LTIERHPHIPHLQAVRIQIHQRKTFMRKCITVAVVSALAFNIGTALASSVLVEKTDGTATAAVLPPDACPVGVVKIRPAPAPREFYFFNPGGGLTIEAARRPGYVTDWAVSLNNVDQTDGSRGNMLQPQFAGNDDTRTLDHYTSFPEDSPAYRALQKVYPDQEKGCFAYMSRSKDKILGIPSDEIEKITFFDDNAKAGSASIALNRKRETEIARRNAEFAAWRKKIQPGTESHCGMVIEVKAPLVKVQTVVGEKWFKTDRIYPAGQKNCTFVNGVYQD
jgi:hypothetical protein